MKKIHFLEFRVGISLPGYTNDVMVLCENMSNASGIAAGPQSGRSEEPGPGSMFYAGS